MYIVEGNIGVGKSTFLKLLAHHMPEVSVALEPLHNWQTTIYGQSLLTNFYQKPRRWAYVLETLTMMCRVKDQLAEQELIDNNRIIERSIYSGHYCFAQNGYESGFINKVEWQIYKDWFNFLIPNKCQTPLGFIYLRANPYICYERTKKRNRLAEKKITLTYLKQIHQKHEAFLIEKKNLTADIKRVPVLTLDCNEEFEQNPSKFKEYVSSLATFIQQTQKNKSTATIDSAMRNNYL